MVNNEKDVKYLFFLETQDISFNTNDISEFSEAVYSFESNYKDLLIESMTNEYKNISLNESSGIMDSIKTFFQKVIELVRTMLGKIKEFFGKLFGFSSKSRNSLESSGKRLDKAQSKAKAAPVKSVSVMDDKERPREMQYTTKSERNDIRNSAPIVYKPKKAISWRGTTYQLVDFNKRSDVIKSITDATNTTKSILKADSNRTSQLKSDVDSKIEVIKSFKVVTDENAKKIMFNQEITELIKLSKDLESTLKGTVNNTIKTLSQSEKEARDGLKLAIKKASTPENASNTSINDEILKKKSIVQSYKSCTDAMNKINSAGGSILAAVSRIEKEVSDGIIKSTDDYFMS